MKIINIKDHRKSIEKVSYEFLKASIFKDSLQFAKCANMAVLTQNINQQKIDAILLKDIDLYHVFIIRYSPWKITLERKSILEKQFNEKNVFFSDYKELKQEMFFIKMKWGLFNANDSMGLYLKQQGKKFFIEDVRFSNVSNW
jgi:hypothetical protein